jgi:hypothetical protein
MTVPERPADLDDHVRWNRAAWNADADAYQARNAATLAAGGSPAWGVWQIPELQLGVLGELAGRTILELGCGGAQLSVALLAPEEVLTGMAAVVLVGRSAPRPVGHPVTTVIRCRL